MAPRKKPRANKSGAKRGRSSCKEKQPERDDQITITLNDRGAANEKSKRVSIGKKVIEQYFEVAPTKDKSHLCRNLPPTIPSKRITRGSKIAQLEHGDTGSEILKRSVGTSHKVKETTGAKNTKDSNCKSSDGKNNDTTCYDKKKLPSEEAISKTKPAPSLPSTRRITRGRSKILQTNQKETGPELSKHKSRHAKETKEVTDCGSSVEETKQSNRKLLDRQDEIDEKNSNNKRSVSSTTSSTSTGLNAASKIKESSNQHKDVTEGESEDESLVNDQRNSRRKRKRECPPTRREEIRFDQIEENTSDVDRTCPQCKKVFSKILGFRYHIKHQVCQKSTSNRRPATVGTAPFLQLEPGSRFITRFGVVEVISDDRLPSVHHKTFIHQKDLSAARRLVKKKDQFNRKKKRVMDAIACEGRRRRELLREMYLSSIRPSTNSSPISQEEVWKLYCKSITPIEILEEGLTWRCRNSDPEESNEIETFNRNDPLEPRDSYPDRIVECMLIDDKRRIIVNKGSSKKGENNKPLWKCSRPDNDNMEELNVESGHTLKIRLFITRRELIHKYDPSVPNWVCYNCGKEFHHKRSWKTHIDDGVCTRNKRDLRNGKENNSGVTKADISASPMDLGSQQTNSHAVLKPKIADVQFGNPYKVKEHKKHRWPGWLVFNPERTTIFPETFILLGFRRGANNSKYFARQKLEENFVCKYERRRQRLKKRMKDPGSVSFADASISNTVTRKNPDAKNATSNPKRSRMSLYDTEHSSLTDNGVSNFEDDGTSNIESDAEPLCYVKRGEINVKPEALFKPASKDKDSVTANQGKLSLTTNNLEPSKPQKLQVGKNTTTEQIRSCSSYHDEKGTGPLTSTELEPDQIQLPDKSELVGSLPFSHKMCVATHPDGTKAMIIEHKSSEKADSRNCNRDTAQMRRKSGVAKQALEANQVEASRTGMNSSPRSPQFQNSDSKETKNILNLESPCDHAGERVRRERAENCNNNEEMSSNSFIDSNVTKTLGSASGTDSTDENSELCAAQEQSNATVAVESEAQAGRKSPHLEVNLEHYGVKQAKHDSPSQNAGSHQLGCDQSNAINFSKYPSNATDNSYEARNFDSLDKLRTHSSCCEKDELNGNIVSPDILDELKWQKDDSSKMDGERPNMSATARLGNQAATEDPNVTKTDAFKEQTARDCSGNNSNDPIQEKLNIDEREGKLNSPASYRNDQQSDIIAMKNKRRRRISPFIAEEIPVSVPANSSEKSNSEPAAPLKPDVLKTNKKGDEVDKPAILTKSQHDISTEAKSNKSDFSPSDELPPKKRRRRAKKSLPIVRPKNKKRPIVVDSQVLAAECEAGRYPTINRFNGDNEGLCCLCKNADLTQHQNSNTDNQVLDCDFCKHSFHQKCINKRMLQKEPPVILRESEPHDSLMCHECISLCLFRRARAENRRIFKWHHELSKAGLNDSAAPSPTKKNDFSIPIPKAANLCEEINLTNIKEASTNNTEQNKNDKPTFAFCPSGGPGGLICCADCTAAYSRLLTNTAKEMEAQSVAKVGQEVNEILELLADAKLRLRQATNVASANDYRRNLFQNSESAFKGSSGIPVTHNNAC